MPWNQALVNALSGRSFADVQNDPTWWGRLVENAVGAHLLNHLPAPEWGLTYWKCGPAEVDYVVERGRTVWALEVKSGRGGRIAGRGRRRLALPGTARFRRHESRRR